MNQWAAIMEDFDEYIRLHPPKCLSGFHLLPSKIPKLLAGRRCGAYLLRCQCSTVPGSFLGYSLASLNPNYQGPIQFVGPLGFLCSSCGNTTEILDTAIHGYHGSLGGGATYRGSGSRVAFPCGKCQSTKMDVTVAFDYWDAALDCVEDEPATILADIFNEFVAEGTCSDCKEEQLIAGFKC